ncbi:radical SAM protein [bacterium]|nr:radical SAM protein [bacterium]
MKIIPAFLPYAGCRSRCPYCNQHVSTGIKKVRTPEEVMTYLNKCKTTLTDEFQVAFYGGTFLALPRERILQYAKAASASGASSLRLSTTASSINAALLTLIGEILPVSDIELGLETISKDVNKFLCRDLDMNEFNKAADIIKALNISLHLHLMTGFPAEKPHDLLNTARFAVSLAPAGIRIHPLIVLKDTQMEEMFKNGKYSPLSLEEAARCIARVLPHFIKNNIPVTRFGLFPDEELVKKGSVIAGPFHPAFGSIVWSRYYRDLLAKRIGPAKGAFTVYAPDKIIHHLIGFKRENISYFNSLGIGLSFKKGARFQLRRSKGNKV